MEEKPRSVRRPGIYYYDAAPVVRLYDLASVESLYHETGCACHDCIRTFGKEEAMTQTIHVHRDDVIKFYDEATGMLMECTHAEFDQAKAGEMIVELVRHYRKNLPAQFPDDDVALHAVCNRHPKLAARYLNRVVAYDPSEAVD